MNVSSNRIVFTFGRFQPPTSGHQSVFRTVRSLAIKKSADHIIFLSGSYDKIMNPLTPSERIQIIRELDPEANTYFNPNIRTIVDAVAFLKMLGYLHLDFVVGQDRLQDAASLVKTISKLGFASYQIHNAGVRNDDSAGISGISSTKARNTARLGDSGKFLDNYMTNPELGKKVYQLLRKATNG
jgi:FAD synthase